MSGSDYLCEVCGRTSKYNLDPRKAELWRTFAYEWPETKECPQMTRMIWACPECAKLSKEQALKGFKARVLSGHHLGFM